MGLDGGRGYEVHGQIRDSETGMDFFTARYYGSALRRFMSPDPANAGADPTDPQTWNAYAYVRNNPLVLVDPMGLCTFDAEGNAVEDENGACYEGGFGGSVTVTASPPPDVMPIFVSLPSLLSDTQQPAPTAPPPAVTEAGAGVRLVRTGTPCVLPSFPQRIIASVLSFLSRRTGLTIGYGTGGSLGAGRKPIAVNYSISMQFVAAPDGTIGKQFSYTPNSASYFSAGTTGYGGVFGLQFSASNARTISDLHGGSVDAEGMIADGLGIGSDVSVGSSGGRVITQGTVTFGFGLGGKGAAGVLTQTTITPFCQ
jgi:RHS repeat-associated protein